VCLTLIENEQRMPYNYQLIKNWSYNYLLGMKHTIRPSVLVAVAHMVPSHGSHHVELRLYTKHQVHMYRS
jgi:hypothetical protein